VSDVVKSTEFYTDVVGCRHLSTTPNGRWYSWMRRAPVSSW
jgi:hypothetical protein